MHTQEIFFSWDIISLFLVSIFGDRTMSVNMITPFALICFFSDCCVKNLVFTILVYHYDESRYGFLVIYLVWDSRGFLKLLPSVWEITSCYLSDITWPPFCFSPSSEMPVRPMLDLYFIIFLPTFYVFLIFVSVRCVLN